MAKNTIRKSKPTLRNILFVIAFIGAFLLVKEFKSEWYSSNSMEEASVTASNIMEKEIQYAKSQSTSEKSATEIISEDAYKTLKNTLNKSGTNKKKMVSASNMFFGAYFLNTRTRPEYCTNLGVDISSFVNEYKNIHHELFLSAEKVQIMDFKEHGRTLDIDELYNVMVPASKKLLLQDMQDTAAYLKITEMEVCQSFEQHSVEWAKAADISKRAPELTQLLLQ